MIENKGADFELFARESEKNENSGYFNVGMRRFEAENVMNGLLIFCDWV